jgi:hypothetical protein
VTIGKDRRGSFISILPCDDEIASCVNIFGTLRRDAESRDKYGIHLPDPNFSKAFTDKFNAEDDRSDLED